MSLNINSPRIIGLDLVRSIAILFVISGHFFSLNTPFRSTNFRGGESDFTKYYHSSIFNWRSAVPHVNGIPQCKQVTFTKVLQRLHPRSVRLFVVLLHYYPV